MDFKIWAKGYFGRFMIGIMFLDFLEFLGILNIVVRRLRLGFILSVVIES